MHKAMATLKRFLDTPCEIIPDNWCRAHRQEAEFCVPPDILDLIRQVMSMSQHGAMDAPGWIADIHRLLCDADQSPMGCDDWVKHRSR